MATERARNAVGEEQAVEDVYQKLTQVEHILKRPDTYIGSTELVNEELWVWNTKAKQMEFREIQYSPGLYKIFDEILVNAADNKQRSDNMKAIKVDIDQASGRITVWNDGAGIPVVIHKKHQVYVPEMIFGELLTGANFNDNIDKVTGGRNGYGLKCLASNTLVPTWDGQLKRMDELTLDDKLIGDDGRVRRILNICKGFGKMYEVGQMHRGYAYQVNDQHILTLHAPDHKRIFWNAEKNGWCALYWDKTTNTLRLRSETIPRDTLLTCRECGESLSSHMKRHYARKHPLVEYTPPKRKPPSKGPTDSEEARAARSRLEQFLSTVPDDSVFDISIQDYLKLNKTTQGRLAGVRGACVEWPKREVHMDPYLLGLWLGDGWAKGYQFSCAEDLDPETIDYLEAWCDKNDSVLKKGGPCAHRIRKADGTGFRHGQHPLAAKLRKYNLIKNKHIPMDYIVNDCETRLKVLAGLVDSDGHVSRNGTRISIAQGMNHEQLANDLVFLVRSLGFYCSSQIQKTSWTHKGEKRFGECISMRITGDLSDIPTRLPRKLCTSGQHSTITTGKITVTEIPDGEYVGVEISGNQRFVLQDFTVTHNCTNIFSRELTATCYDMARGKKYKQTWTDNMSNKGKASITSLKRKSGDFVQVEFVPDLARFHMEALTDDVMALMTKRVYDIAGCNTDLRVYFNKERLPINSFQHYVKLYPLDPQPDGKPYRIVYESPHERWEVAATVSTSGNFRQVSFVNSIATHHGGSHVEHVVRQISKTFVDRLNKKNKGATIKPSQIKNHLWIFVRALIVNPTFDSQTKHTLTSKVSNFGSRCELTDKFFNSFYKSGIEDFVLSWATFKAQRTLKSKGGKKTSRLRGIAKLDDANDAGTRRSKDCTLIVTEGDSAKTLAVCGLSVVGRDKFGVFPLRGKPLNVRQASAKQIANNEEINNLLKILGLRVGEKYTSLDGLRYGKLMIMADQDVDGSHIKGLLLNFIDHFWPELLSLGFVVEFITPIVKARRGQETLSFYTLPEYEAWKADNDVHRWSIKYYKGLGTSERSEAREYFSALDRHRVNFAYVKERDQPQLQLAFQKNKAEDRKQWIADVADDTYLSTESGHVTVDAFINREMVLFSVESVRRAIPHIMDGLKPSQRKVLFSAFKRNLVKSIKVAQFAGYVSEKAAYHHGEDSLQSTIIGMAQNYVGSNNITLLYPEGQYGSRLLGGKDASAARYIHTRLTDMTRLLFHPDDDALLNYLEDDGMSIEPEHYVPILPMVLVNGAQGISTGWATTIPNYNPRDIVANLLAHIQGDPMSPMHPWYLGFKGTIVRKVSSKTGQPAASYKVLGVWEQADSGERLEITELPVGTWTQPYKEFLESQLVDAPTPKDAFVADYKEYHSDSSVHFVVTLAEDKLSFIDEQGIEKTFKLSSSLSVNNMVLFDTHGKIRRYETALDILQEFYHTRLDFYDRRKRHLVAKLTREWEILDNKVRFIEGVIENQLIVRGKPKSTLMRELGDFGLKRFTSLTGGDGNDEEDASSNGYDYLLRMAIWSLTREKADQLIALRNKKRNELDRIVATSPTDMWKSDLQAFLEAWDTFEAEMTLEAEAPPQAAKPRAKGKKRARSRAIDLSTTSSKPQKSKVSSKQKRPRDAAPKPKNSRKQKQTKHDVE